MFVSVVFGNFFLFLISPVIGLKIIVMLFLFHAIKDYVAVPVGTEAHIGHVMERLKNGPEVVGFVRTGQSVGEHTARIQFDVASEGAFKFAGHVGY